MAQIRPFRCIHPAPGLEAEVAALPYDVYSSAEARKAVEGKPLSFLNIDRPETQFPEDQDMYAPEVYQKARQMLKEQLQEGVYVQEEHPCYYLYELTMNGRSQTGIVACASIDDYVSGVIRKHENTRADKEEDRIRHVDTCDAQTGPIFLAYRKDDAIQAVTARVKEGEPAFSFTSEDGITHRGWRIDGTDDLATIRERFKATERIYIADGHHRAVSAVKVGLKRRQEHACFDGSEEFNYFLSVLFPDEELMIMDYNRVVKDLNGMTAQEFMKKLETVCEIRTLTQAEYPQEKGEVSMYLGGSWYGLRFLKAVCSEDPVDGLDVAVLQNAVLTPMLGIGDPRTDKRIDFVGGIRGLGELERRVDEGWAVSFAMYPTSIHELFAVADAERLMPPKSTWFEPKLRSGLFIHKLL